MDFKGRKKCIFDILYEKGRVSVPELSKLLYVSEMTVRRDLTEMEKTGVLKRFRGGAVLTTAEDEMPIAQRFFVDEDEKKFLSRKAAENLTDNIFVYIDSSSTCHYIIPHIAKLCGITIVTNSVNALLLASKLQIPCVLIGGNYYSADKCFTGAIAEQYAEQYNVDVAFFSSRGLSDDGIISDSDIEQTAVRRIIMKNSAKNIFLFEKSKLSKKFVYTVCRREQVDEVILSDCV